MKLKTKAKHTTNNKASLEIENGYLTIAYGFWNETFNEWILESAAHSKKRIYWGLIHYGNK